MSERYVNVNQEENASEDGVIVGESAGIINDLPGARDLTRRLGEQTVVALSTAGQIIRD